MKRQQLKLAGLIFGLGLLGILSMLTMKIPIPEEMKQQLLEAVPEESIKWVLLINPTIMLLFGTLLGSVFYKKVNLQAPILENIAGEKYDYDLIDILKTGVLGGIVAGIGITAVAATLQSSLPQEFIDFGKKLKPPLAARFLYGGILEEISVRFGFMTFIVWLVSKISKNLSPTSYWIGIIVAALIFAAGHLPIATMAVENPTTSLYAYIILGNSVGGLVFGWLYWKKGLEAAMIGHIFAHLVMIASEQLFNLA